MQPEIKKEKQAGLKTGEQVWGPSRRQCLKQRRGYIQLQVSQTK